MKSQKKNLKKMFSLLLAIVMLFTAMPETVLAENEGTEATVATETTVEETQTEEKSVTVDFSISKGTTQFYNAKTSKEILIPHEITVPYFDLATYGLADFYYNPDCYTGATQTAGTKEQANGIVTTMHVFLYATELFYCGLDAEQAGTGLLYSNGDMDDYISWSGGVGSTFMDLWDHGTNLNYYINYTYPLGRAGWGSTSDQQALKDGDIISVHLIEDDTVYGSKFGFFVANDTDGVYSAGDVVDKATVQQGESLSLSLYYSAANYTDYTTNYTLKDGSDIWWTDENGLTSDITEWKRTSFAGVEADKLYTDENGKITLDTTNVTPGTYYIAAEGFIEDGLEAAPAIFTLTVTGKADTPSNSETDQTTADQAAAEEVMSKITAVGEVTLESETAIAEARAAYDALTDSQKELVTNYADLTEAETALADLQKEAADQAAAEEVMSKITAIGEVTLESETAIAEARAAYDALTEEQKALVTNLDTLTAAEAALEELKTPQVAETPVFYSAAYNLSTKSAVYYKDDAASDVSSFYIMIKNSTGLGTLTAEWQQSEDGENFTPMAGMSTTMTKSGTSWKSSTLTPEFTVGKTTYYRVAVTNTVEGYTPATAYSEVAVIEIKDEERPILKIYAPKVLDEETGTLTEASDINAKTTVSKYPYKVSSINRSTGYVMRVTDNSWDTMKYEFAGWMMDETFLPKDGDVVIDEKTTGYENAFKYKSETGNPTWKIYSDAPSSTVTYWTLKFTSTDSESYFYPAQPMKLTPVFTVKEDPAYTITVTAGEGGSVSYVRGSGESYTLTAKAKDYYVFDHWEASKDGEEWTTVSSEASFSVELKENTQYKAIFAPITIKELKIQDYALPSEGNSLILRAPITLDNNTTCSTKVTLDIYEGNEIADDKSNLLGSSTYSISSGKKEALLEASATDKRVSSDTAEVLLVATLPNGESAQETYTLKGTLDIFPSELTIDTIQTIFLTGVSPQNYQLAASGSPAVDNVTWSGGSAALSTSTGSAIIDAKTGMVSYSRYYSANSARFMADAGDGRIAFLTIQFKPGNKAIKLEESKVKVNQGEAEEYTAVHSVSARTIRVSTDKVTVSSSDESVFTASIVTRTSGSYTDYVDKIKINGVSAGTATLTIDVNGNSWSCPITVASYDVAMDQVTIDQKKAKVQVDDTISLVAEVTPVTAAVGFRWTSLDPTIASVDADGVVTGKREGTAVITVTATDGSGNTLTDSCEVTVADDPYCVKIYVPKNVVGENGLSVYPSTGFDAEGKDTFEAGKQVTLEKDTKTDADYDIYSASLKKGTYSFRAEDAEGKSLGGGAFVLPAEQEGSTYQDRDETKIYLRLAECYITNESNGKKAGFEDFTAKLQNKIGVATLGEGYVNAAGYSCYPALLYVNGNALLYYSTGTPSEAYATANSVGSTTVKESAISKGTSTAAIAIKLNTASNFTINAPKGAEVAIYQQIMNFNTVRIDYTSTVELEDGTVDYIFNVARNRNTSFRVSMEGKRTQAGFFSNIASNTNRIEVKLEDMGDAKEQDIAGKTADESSLLLNLNERNKLELEEGESFKLRSYRAAWQIINTITENIMIEPDFNYKVLYGKDVISIDTMDAGNGGDNWAWITAKKKGVAIVEVSYDALDNIGETTLGWNEVVVDSFYGACDPNRTGVFVVTVGDEYNDISCVEWDAEYDTCYFFDDNGYVTLEPVGDNVTVEVASVWKGTLSDFKTVKATDGNYNVPIVSGNNVVKITSDGMVDYRVIRGAKITVNFDDGDENSNTIDAGDTVTVKLDGLYQPIPKFSGIYNPGWTNTMVMTYEQGDEKVSSKGRQYSLIEASFTVEISEDATEAVVLENGKISGTSMGSVYGSHRLLTDVGVPANFNASAVELDPIELPEICIELGSKENTNLAKANEVVDKIDAIGEVTFEKESVITEAREAYNALTNAQKRLVTNYAKLTEAEAKLAQLYREKADKEDLEQANAVVAKIAAIGTVTLDSESKIVEARKAYNALTEAQKKLVTNYAVLVDAETELAELKKEKEEAEQTAKDKKEKDQKAAKEVIAKIAAIGTVTLDSEDAIIEAREAYDALTEDQKVLVTNYDVLTAAEAAYEQLEDADEEDEEEVEVGDRFTVGKYIYKVTKASGNNRTVEFVKAKKKTEKKITVPASVKIEGKTYKVTSIGDKAFQKNTSLTSVTIGKNVTSVGNYAFAGCSKLTSVTIGNSVTSIGSYAFDQCSKLTGITLPSKVTKIGAYAFRGCKKLKTITIKSKKMTSKTINKKAFKGVNKNTTIKVPSSKKKAYTTLFRKCGLSKNVKVKS